jgi:hypothetical protein
MSNEEKQVRITQPPYSTQSDHVNLFFPAALPLSPGPLGGKRCSTTNQWTFDSGKRQMSWILSKVRTTPAPELSRQPGWEATSCEGGMLQLGSAPEGHGGDGGSPAAPAILLRVGANPQERWVLVGDESIRVNGTPLTGGIRVLDHQDEIHIGEEAPVYFSADRPARVVPFPGGERPIRCPRCRQEIRPGDLAVQCGRCGIWHHECEEYRCWTYPQAETCAACRVQPNTLDEGPSWFPEE